MCLDGPADRPANLPKKTAPASKGDWDKAGLGSLHAQIPPCECVPQLIVEHLSGKRPDLAVWTEAGAAVMLEKTREACFLCCNE